MIYLKNVHEEGPFVYLANYINFCGQLLFSLCITIYRISTIIKQRLPKGSIATGIMSSNSARVS